MSKNKKYKLSFVAKLVILMGMNNFVYAVGNNAGFNIHDDGVSWGSNSFNGLTKGVVNGKNAIVTKDNITREQYNQNMLQYRQLLEEKKQLENSKNELSNNRDLNVNKINLLDQRIRDINNELINSSEKFRQIENYNNQKNTLLGFIDDVNTQIRNKENKINLTDKTRIYEFEDFYKTLNKLNWNKYSEPNGVDNLANQLRSAVYEFNPNIANKYNDDKYKEIINAYVNLNSIDKQTTVDWINNQLISKEMGLGDNFKLNNELGIDGSNYKFFDFKYKNKRNNNNDIVYVDDVGEYTTYRRIYNKNESNYDLRRNDYDNYKYYNENNSIESAQSYNYKDTNAKNVEKIWRYKDKYITDQYLDELEWMYNNFNNTSDYSLYVTRNTLRAALNKEAPNLKLKNVEKNELYGVDYLTTLYANFGDINLTESLQKVINFTNKYYDNKKDFHDTVKLDAINNENINKANNLANNFIRDYEMVDLNATAKNVVSIEETRNLFKPFYDKMIQLRDITNLYKEINSGTLDENTKQQKQAIYLQKLSDYRNALNAEIDHYDTLEGYIAHFVRPHVRYSDEFVNHFKTAIREYIDFLKANRYKLLNYDPNDQFIKEISDSAKSIIADLNNLKAQKLEKERKIEEINESIKQIKDTISTDANALAQEKQNKEAELEQARRDKDQIDNQIVEKERELTRKQEEILEKMKKQTGEGNAMAYGDNSFASGASAIAIGVDSETTGDHAISLGTQAKSTKTDSVSIGHGSEVSGEQSIAMGKGHNVSGNKSTTIGSVNNISGNESVAIGNNNAIKSNNVMVLGNNVTVDSNLNDAVVLGSNSTVLSPVGTASHTILNETYNFAGINPIASVSIGSDGKERTLTNLAAGRISSTSTDGINGSQLNAVVEALDAINTKITNLKNNSGKAPVIKAGDGLALRTEENGDIVLSSALTFEGGAGINVNKEGNKITITNTQPLTSEDKNKYDSSSEKANSAIQPDKIIAGDGIGINKNEKGEVIITNNRNGLNKDDLIAGNGITINQNGNKIEISSNGNNGGNDGNVTNKPNVSLKVGSGISIKDVDGKREISTNINNGSGIEIVKNEDGSININNNIEAGKGINFEKNGNKIVINSTPIKTKIIDDEDQFLETNEIKIKGSENISSSLKDGNLSISLKDNISVKKISANNVEIKEKIVVGNHEFSKDGLSISTVKINEDGISAGEKVIKDVKDGEISETSKEAINGSQLYKTNKLINQLIEMGNVNQNAILNEKIDKLSQNVEKNNKALRSGIASSVAIASLPQVFTGGKSVISAGTGHYKNQNALAVGYSRSSDNGKLIIKLNGSVNTNKDVAFGTGIGYQW